MSIIGEALIFGLANALTFFALTGMKMTIYTRVILTGAFVHLIFEYSRIGKMKKAELVGEALSEFESATAKA